MTNKEKYIMVLEERIKTAHSKATETAYIIALEHFKTIFKDDK